MLSELNDFEVAIDYGRENDEHENCLYEQVIDKKLHSFVGKIVLFFNHKSLVY